MAAYAAADLPRLLADPGIVRNRLKIEAAIRNARGVLDIREAFGSLDAFLWRYVDDIPGRTSGNAWPNFRPEPRFPTNMSKDLKKRGFNFVGSTICYAFIQAVPVNDYMVDCFRYKEVNANGPTR